MVLAGIAMAAIVVLSLMARGVRGTLSIGPLHLSAHDYVKPLAWGALAAGILLIVERASARWRRVALVMLALLGGLAIVNFALQAAPIITDSDIAISELYVELATRGRLLVGAYSRFGWHHPGPLYFYAVAPFYALSGHQAAALYATALALNLAALAVILWVMTREANAASTTMVVGVCLLFAWRLPWFLASPWNAHVAVMPSLAFLVVAAAVASGRRRLLPLMALVGSFAAQTHVGFVPLVLGITIVVGVRALYRRNGASLWPAVNAALWVTAVLWLWPLSEAIANGGGNVAALWRFFVTESGTGHSIREALLNGSVGLTGIVRPDLVLPWGGHFDLDGLRWSVPFAIVEVVLLAVVARRSFSLARTFDGCLASVALVATAISLWGITRLQGDVLNHDVFRLSAVGALNLGILAGEALRRVIERAGRWSSTPGVVAASNAFLVLMAASIGVRDLMSMTTFEQTRRERAAIVDAYGAVRNYIASNAVRKPLIRTGQDRVSDAAGVLLRLAQDGTPAAVMDSDVSVLSPAFAATGDEDALITLADLGLHRELREQPDNVILLQAFPLFVDATRLVPRRPGGRE